MHKNYTETIRKIYSRFSKSEFKLSKEERAELLNQHLRPNQFLTVTDIATQTFDIEHTREVENILGIEKEQFTSELFSTIVEPTHLPLSFEYAIIAFSLLMTEGYNFNNCYGYIVEFDAFHFKSNERLRLERFCWLFDFENGRPSKILDIWTDKTQHLNNSEFVLYSFYTPNTNNVFLHFYESFYESWSKRMDISFTDDQFTILALIKEGKSFKYISKNVRFSSGDNFAESTVKTYVAKMRKAVNNRIDVAKEKTKNKGELVNSIENGLEVLISNEDQVSSIIGLIRFVEKYGLLRINQR